MVFESVVSNLLNTYLNQFIDDLSANQLKIGAFSGHVELSNLAIKANAFDSINLPFKVVYGLIGKLTATIPWVSLYTSPVMFNIKDVYILCVPNTDCKYDEAYEKKLIESDKRKQLQSIEEAMRLAHLKERGLSDNQSDDFVSKLVAQIVRNLQIHIDNIHICYEDKFTNPKRPFSIGLTLKQLTFVTLDNTNPKYSSAKKENCFGKDVTLQFLSIYWRGGDKSNLLSEMSEKDLPATFQERIANETNAPKLTYILKPISFSAVIHIERKPKEENFVPQVFDKDISLNQSDSYLIDLTLENFPISLTYSQYQRFLEWSNFVNRTKKIWKHRKWRPNKSIKESPRDWWFYAINANLERVRLACKARTKEAIIQRIKDINDYCDVYYMYLTEPEAFSEEMDEIKERIEDQLSLEELVILRQTVYENIRKNRETLSVQSNNSNSWTFQSWYNWWYSQPGAPIDDKDKAIEDALSELNHEADMGNVAIHFKVPEFTLELITGVNSEEQKLARIIMKDFILLFKTTREDESEAQVTLKSLEVEDLSAPHFSKHRFLMSSKIRNYHYDQPKPSDKHDYLSSSCPSSSHDQNYPKLSPCMSLPSKLQSANIYNLIPHAGSRYNRTKVNCSGYQKVNMDRSIPYTPPPSPTDTLKDFTDQEDYPMDNDSEDTDETLVKMTIIFVGENSPLFETEYNRNHRLITVRFNSLIAIINPETWAKILNFFEPLPIKQSRYQQLSHSYMIANLRAKSQPNYIPENTLPQPIIDSKMDLTVRRFTIIFNKHDDEPLAKANIMGFSCLYSKSNNDVTMEGKLKKLCLIDLTEYNTIYKERFITSGKEALHFEFFRYGQEDENLHREFDMSLKLQMSSVQYVHTQRFYSEIMALQRNFNALQLKIRAISSPELLMTPQRSTRINLDIKAAAPVIVIPVHHLCDKVLVADFGQLIATNKFLLAGSPGTIGTACKKSGLSHSDLIAASVRAMYGVVTRVSSQSLVSRYMRLLEPKPCLLDVINVQLSEMDLYPGVVSDKRNLSNSFFAYQEATLDFPSFSVKRLPGKILKDKFVFYLQIERNLEAEFNHSLPDVSMLGKVSTVHCTLNSALYQLVRGILDNNLSESIDSGPIARTELDTGGLNILLPNRIWTSMALHLDLKDVSLEIYSNSHCSIGEKVLSRIDFLSSRLLIESYTDSTKDIDLISQDIRIIDARYLDMPVDKRPNVFPDILQSVKKGSSSTPLQLEIQYRCKRDQVGLTILLNNMRVMAIFDWFKELSDFLSQPISYNNSPLNPIRRNPVNTDQAAMGIYDDSPDFELKFNITDTELVVVENCAIFDTNAVILKGTAILNLATDITHPEPFNCALQGIEVFSCILGAEDLTALSIVDPLNITIDLAQKVLSHSILQENGREEVVLVFDISEISLHLSFQDIFLFVKILNSLPTQTKVLSRSPDSPSESGNDSYKGVFAVQHLLYQLQSLGFKRNDCIKALETCRGDVDEAAIWLKQNVVQHRPLESPDMSNQIQHSRFSKFNFQIVCIQIHSCIFCLIDDCKDTDVPIFEIRFNQLNLWQRFASKVVGVAQFEVAADHFNRGLSGWQPVLEKWGGKAEWSVENRNDNLQKIQIVVESADKLNLVITNSCLQQYQAVLETWMDEYERLTKHLDKQLIKRRSPFIPFAIKNESGCDLRFYKVTDNLAGNCSSGNQIASQYLSNDKQLAIYTGPSMSSHSVQWIHVKKNEIKPFSFNEKAKSRHQDSYLYKSHKIVVQIEGWQAVFPVSIDKVGKYFREANPEDNRYESARIVFDVSLEANARKLITVRSALLLTNATNNAFEVKLDAYGFSFLYIVPRSTIPVPLNFIGSKIYARPCDNAVSMCETPIQWENIRRPSDSTSELLSCTPVTVTLARHNSHVDYHRYMFVSIIVRENIPYEMKQRSEMRATKLLPGHHITFLSPLQIINMLPFDIKYKVNDGQAEGVAKTNVTNYLPYIDSSKEFTVYFAMEGYPRSNPITVTPILSNDISIRLELFDRENRPLYLVAHIGLNQNSPFALTITIQTPYWLTDILNPPLKMEKNSHRNYGLANLDSFKNSNSEKKGPQVDISFLFKPSKVEVSLVNNYNEEIMCLHFFELFFEYRYKSLGHCFNCSVRYIQADNQLFDAEKSVIFHTKDFEDNSLTSGLPALCIFAHKLVLPGLDVHIFEDVLIKIKDTCLYLEEYFVLKFYEFLGYPKTEADRDTAITTNQEIPTRPNTNRHALSFYFANFRIELDNIKLSVTTSSHLPAKLNQIKKKIRLRLVQFEDAKIELMPFQKTNCDTTLTILMDQVVKHYRRLLKSQAAKILGTVDFLGNPLGFVNDVTDGLSELINEGNVSGLILNLAHGISDSTAKFTSVLSDGLGVVTMDDRHQEIRKRIKHESNDHIKAGIKGLGVGILGGFTSIITQTYEGAVNEGGVGGFFGGLGKGLLGTFTKPAVGMLDFASSAATAVRDTSKKFVKDGSMATVGRIRPPRPRFSAYGPNSLLPHYSHEQALAQEFFYKSSVFDDKDDDEVFISFQKMRPDAVVFVTSHKIHFITWSETNPNERGRGQISISFEFLIRCEVITQPVPRTNSSSTSHSTSISTSNSTSSSTTSSSTTSSTTPQFYFISLHVMGESCVQGYGCYYKLANIGNRRLKIRCMSELISKETMHLINVAKASYQELNYTIVS